MAVIYMPQDQRSQAWGQAIQNFVGAYTSGLEQKKIQKAFDDGADPGQLMAMAGADPQMQEFVKQIVAAQTAKAAMGLTTAETQRYQLENEEEPQRMDLLKAQTGEAEQKMQEDKLLLPGKIAIQQAQASLARAEAAKAPQEIAVAQAQVDLKKQELFQQQQQMRAMGDALQAILGGGQGGGAMGESEPAGADQQPVPFGSTMGGGGEGQTMSPVGPASLKPGFQPAGLGAPQTSPMGIDLSSPIDRARLAVSAGKPSEFLSTLGAIKREQMQQKKADEAMKALPAPQVQEIASDAALASDLNGFLKTLPNIGTGGIPGWLTHKGSDYGFLNLTDKLQGLSAGDAVAERYATELLNNAVRNGAVSGGGFMSKPRIDLAKSVLPNYTKDKVTNLVSIGVAATTAYERAKAQKEAFSRTKPSYDVSPFDTQMQSMKAIMEHVNSFELDEKSGALIDHQELDSLIPANGVKAIGGKATVTRDDVVAMMKRYPQADMNTVYQRLLQNKGKVLGGDDASNE